MTRWHNWEQLTLGSYDILIFINQIKARKTIKSATRVGRCNYVYVELIKYNYFAKNRADSHLTDRIKRIIQNLLSIIIPQ